MLDDTTPHVAVPVQAIRNGFDDTTQRERHRQTVSQNPTQMRGIDTKLSNERGKYQFVNLKPGHYQVRCQILGGYVYYRAKEQEGKKARG